MTRLTLLLLCFVLICLPAFAKEAEKSTVVSASLYRKLSKVEKLIDKKAYSKARKTLMNALGSVKKGTYEEAVVLRTLASVYAMQEQYSQAAKYLSKALALEVLPEKQRQQALLNLGQIYMALGKYAKAVKILQPVLKANSKLDAQMAILLANAYTQLKQYHKALPYVEQAIRMSKKPPESWYQLNLALLYELGRYSAAASILEQLIAKFPEKKQYWMQLSSVYQQLKQYKKALAIRDLAYRKGLITKQKEILDLVNLYLYVDLPYKAARLLQTEINNKRVKGTSKNWELLANAWTQAKEYKKATQALEKASSLNPKGTLYQQLGRIYVEQENWPAAINALTKALQKGGLKDPGNAYLLLGMSYYELKKINKAKHAFIQAKKYKKTRKSARQWLDYISSEQDLKS